MGIKISRSTLVGPSIFAIMMVNLLLNLNLQAWIIALIYVLIIIDLILMNYIYIKAFNEKNLYPRRG